MAPIFFFSYARDDFDQQLDAFYKALVESVRVKIGPVPAGTGFMDTSVDVGDKWPDGLTTALQRCNVFVPVYTATYFTRPYCGKEWSVFRARQLAHEKKYGGKRPTLVIPVLWGAKEDLPVTLPEELLELQFTTPAFGQHYAEYGLLVLMKQSRFHDAREQAIELLARRIKDASVSVQLAPLATDPVLKTVQQLFPKLPSPIAPPIVPGRPISPILGTVAPEGGPRFVQLVLVAGAKDEFQGQASTPDSEPEELRRSRQFYGDDCLEWRPYRPAEERRAGAIAAQVAAERDFITINPRRSTKMSSHS
jgi:hypothetical protein